MDRHIIKQNETIRKALEQLNNLSGEAMTLIVTDADHHAIGTLPDGDIRRSIIAGHQLDDMVYSIAYRQFEYVRKGSAEVARLKELRQRGIRLIPVLDNENHLCELIDLNTTANRLPVSALIMAGGKGERLRPLTLSKPKPLLEIEGKAIIDYNVEALAKAGIDNITVSTKYLAEQIENHFSKSVAGVDVRCMREDEPMGTIGAIAMVDDFTHSTVLVMNSDLLTDISFEDMYIKHVEEEADITVAAIPYTLSVPFAILSTEGSRITALEEKPVYSYYANAGIYLISEKAAAMVKRGERTDATDLIERAIASGLKVVYFPINGTWIDVGTPADFRHAADIMKYHLNR